MIQKIILWGLSLFDYSYQKKWIKFLKKNKYNDFKILVDIGAHKGESIKLFSKNFIIKKIISFEASPINFEFLKKKIDENKQEYNNTEIVLENIALGAENKIIEFNQFNESSSSTIKDINKESKYYKRKFRLINFLNNKKTFQKIKIKVLKLKDYIEKNNIKKIDFIKIDTEGYEFEILLGLENKIKLVDIIMFEHHYDNMIKKGYTFENINKLLIKNNFNKIYKSRMPFRKTFEYIYKREESIN
ncbi:MAG: FkbM family methyltransferase [Candidatus Pelagibacter bacterium]|nr:FkbM family methyltransferase [Candidatus Pelagibacter bacterium]